MNAAEKRDYQAGLRQLKDLRPKCRCGQPTCGLGDGTRCRNCWEQLTPEGKAWQRKLGVHSGAVTETRIYVCPQCLDTTDDPSHLCKCLD